MTNDEHLHLRCSVIVSVCPPHAAETVADQVLSCSFSGLYLDANAISPERAIRIGRKMAQAGVAFVDGGIIGGPAWEPGRTWLCLSGERAQNAASLFSAGPPTAASPVSGMRPLSRRLKQCWRRWLLMRKDLKVGTGFLTWQTAAE